VHEYVRRSGNIDPVHLAGRRLQHAAQLRAERLRQLDVDRQPVVKERRCAAVRLVDDLITTGESVIEAAEVVRDQGGVVNEMVVLLDREKLESTGIGDGIAIPPWPVEKVEEILRLLWSLDQGCGFRFH
jgi:orotate phosphoribosyltransferase